MNRNRATPALAVVTAGLLSALALAGCEEPVPSTDAAVADANQADHYCVQAQGQFQADGHTMPITGGRLDKSDGTFVGAVNYTYAGSGYELTVKSSTVTDAALTGWEITYGMPDPAQFSLNGTNWVYSGSGVPFISGSQATVTNLTLVPDGSC